MNQKLLKKNLLHLLIISTLLFYSTVFAQQPPAPQVRVMAIEEQNVVPADEYVGHVEAIQSVELRPRVEGFLEEVSFTEGDYVQEGQVLYRIEPDGYAARVAMEKARVAQAEAELA
ncbi:MAG: biotin/lipoyl-binding protein, partial [Desulfotignum sp.]|nr:biotin/lipoyl-binding protein [Desulfotignum sp.]